MEYSKLVAVTGLPGLFELISNKGEGAIVRSLEDQSTKFISSRVHHFSHLDSIEVYTVGDNVPLAAILLAMKAAGEKLPDSTDAVAVRNYFEKVYPDLDFDRVYSSDLKKMVRWMSVLEKHNIDIRLPEEVEEEPAEDAAKESNDKTGMNEHADQGASKKGKKK